MTNSRRPGAIVIGGDFQGLGVIRCLKEKDIPVFLVDFEWSVGRFSKYARRRCMRIRSLSEEAFARDLIELCRKENLQGWIVYPNDDLTVKLLSRTKDLLSSYIRVPVPRWSIVEKFYTKSHASKIAQRIGIPVPKIYEGTTIEQILAQGLEFPIVLKPVNKEKFYPATKKKAIRINDKDSFIREYENLLSMLHPEEIIVQEMILGGGKNLFSYGTFFDGKRSISGISAARIRQHPITFGKATTFAVSVTLPEIEAMAVKLLAEIGYYGLAEVEFMRDDKDGLFKFLEINGRPWGWHTLAKIAGVNLPALLYQHMVGEPMDVREPEIGVKWIRLLTDVPVVAHEILAGRMSITEYLSSIKGKREDAVLSKVDPLPFFGELFLLPYLWYKRGF